MAKNIISFTLAILIFSCAVAYAHPPSDITISFDPSTRTLTAAITHDVNNPKTHYIRKVDVALNGKEIIEHMISRQDNNAGQTVVYVIPDVNENDSISVEAYCSISGKLQKEIRVSSLPKS